MLDKGNKLQRPLASGKAVDSDTDLAQSTAHGVLNSLTRSAKRAVTIGEGGGRVIIGTIQGYKDGDWSQAKKGATILWNESLQTAKGLAKAGIIVGTYGCKSAGALAQAGYGYYTDDTHHKQAGMAKLKKNLTPLAVAVAAGLIAHEILDALVSPELFPIHADDHVPFWPQNELSHSDIFMPPLDTGSGYIPAIDVDAVPGIYQGVATPEALATLTHLGEVSGTHHIVDVVRDQSAIADFLSQHGFAHTPPGYEVHHIIPLSEGGADLPANMILVPEDMHARITAAHAKFYGWSMDF